MPLKPKRLIRLTVYRHSNEFWFRLHYDTYEMTGLRKIRLVSWTATKTNEWVFNKAGVKRELLDMMQ